MTAGLTRLVRQNETRRVTPPKLIWTKKTSGSGDETVVVTYGKGWSTKTMNGSENYTATYYCQRATKEMKK